MVPLGAWFVVLGYLMIVGMSNAVNLTDGLDGLAILPAVMVGAALGLIAYVTGNIEFSNLQIPYIAGSGELAVFCGALIGAGWVFSGSTPIRRKFSWAMSGPLRLARRWGC